MIKIPKFKKRVSRQEVILDIDDKYLLVFLSSLLTEQERYTKGNVDMMKKILNIGHSSLLVHIKRLKRSSLVQEIRIPPKNINKVFLITKKGREVVQLLWD